MVSDAYFTTHVLNQVLGLQLAQSGQYSIKTSQVSRKCLGTGAATPVTSFHAALANSPGSLSRHCFVRMS